MYHSYIAVRILHKLLEIYNLKLFKLLPYNRENKKMSHFLFAESSVN